MMEVQACSLSACCGSSGPGSGLTQSLPCHRYQGAVKIPLMDVETMCTEWPADGARAGRASRRSGSNPGVVRRPGKVLLLTLRSSPGRCPHPLWDNKAPKETRLPLQGAFDEPGVGGWKPLC